MLKRVSIGLAAATLLAMGLGATSLAPYPLGAANLQPTLSVAGDGTGLGANSPRYLVTPPSSYDGVASLLIATMDGGLYGCSGSLLADGIHVLTAAHCVTNLAGQLDATGVTVTFMLSDGAHSYSGVDYAIAPGWNGTPDGGADLALVQLDQRPGIAGYDLVRNLPGPEDVDLAGYGTYGTGASGATGGFGTLRHGGNRYDVLFVTALGQPMAFGYDFDDGSGTHDTFGRVFGINDLGLGEDEVLAVPGDSGGPTFWNGRLVGVHSFYSRFGPPGCANCDLDAVQNGTFGEFGGDSPVPFYADWIDSQTAPEPSTICLLAGGAAALLLRRRRRML